MKFYNAEFNLTDEERAIYEREVKLARDAEDIERLKLARAEEKGMLEGEKKGKIEAMREIAKKMLETNIPITTIANITGLSIEEIQNLKS